MCFPGCRFHGGESDFAVSNEVNLAGKLTLIDLVSHSCLSALIVHPGVSIRLIVTGCSHENVKHSLQNVNNGLRSQEGLTRGKISQFDFC